MTLSAIIAMVSNLLASHRGHHFYFIVSGMGEFKPGSAGISCS
jgi:hypothetical protein